jgi:hypothetical protein
MLVSKQITNNMALLTPPKFNILLNILWHSLAASKSYYADPDIASKLDGLAEDTDNPWSRVLIENRTEPLNEYPELYSQGYATGFCRELGASNQFLSLITFSKLHFKHLDLCHIFTTKSLSHEFLLHIMTHTSCWATTIKQTTVQQPLPDNRCSNELTTR